MKQISKLRFDALAGYIRKPQAGLFGEELEWYSEGDERIVSAVIRDLDDDDFSAVLLGRDARGRFRAIEILPFVNSVAQVRIALEPAMRGWAVRSDADYQQGDERGRPIDLFTPVVPRDRFHPHFAQVWQDEQFSPARKIISAMHYYLSD